MEVWQVEGMEVWREERRGRGARASAGMRSDFDMKKKRGITATITAHFCV